MTRSRRRRTASPAWTSLALEPRLMLAGDVAVEVSHAVKTAETVTSVVFIDSAVDDVDALAAAATEGADVVLLDNQQDAITQITQALRGRSGIESIQIVAHGSAGQLSLAGRVVDVDALAEHRSDLAQWSQAMQDGGDILLFGCNTGAGESGRQFVHWLSRWTGADVAASTNRTGHDSLGGDWILERQFGQIETSLAMNAAAVASYRAHLPITIRAAGFEGDEQMELRIDGATVQTWNTLGTGGASGDYRTFTYDVDGIDAGRISIGFTNARWDPAAGIDSNLRVDQINVDGVIFETEDPSVFSTGTWKAVDGIVPGFRESEFLHTNGEFRFASPEADGSLIRILAEGARGEERMSLLIDGNVVASYDVTDEFQFYQYQASDTVTADQIRVSFDNDFYDPANGIDRNLRVDFIEVDSETFQSEGDNVFSTGTWLPEDGVTPGFRNSETLHAGGYFQYEANSTAGDPGTIGLGETQVTVNEDNATATVEVIRYDGSDGQATAFYQTLGVEANDGQDFEGTDSGRIDFADGQTSAFITVNLIDDNELEDVETFRVSLFRTEQAELGVPRTAIVSIVDDEAGADLVGYWKLDETSIGQSVQDSSGLGNDGVHRNMETPSGPDTDAPNTDTTNPGSLSFDGVNDFVSIPADASLDLSRAGTFTQSVWIKPEITDNDFHGILGYQPSTGGSANRYAGIWVDDQTKIHAGFGDGTNWNSFTTASVLTSGQWNHVATTFDGTSYKALVNGREVFSTDEYAGRSPVAGNRVDIGRVDNFFEGGIDEVRIYNRALSATEIDVLIDGADLPLPVIEGQFVTSTIASGFTNPLAVDWLPDGRMLVAEQEGLVKLVNFDGSVASTPVLDIRSIVNNGTKDRGMLGFAVHPEFADNPFLYVSYTYDPPEVNGQSGLGGPDGNGARVARVSRFEVNGNIADASSEVVLVGENSTYDNIGTPNKRPDLGDDHSCFDANGNPIEDCIPSDETSHTIGDLEFGPDGALYVSTGDGGSFGRADPVNLRSLDLDSMAGKILRIDPLTGEGLADNPFFDGDLDTNVSKVYSYGLRNPFRIAVNQNNGEVFAGDVGWTRWEEINTGRGANFGWPAFEGGSDGQSLRTGRYQDLAEVQAYYATNPTVTPPAWARLHSDGGRAIVMGDFLSNAYGEQLEGALLFTDIGDQVLRVAQFESDGTIGEVEEASSPIGFLVDFQTGQDGLMYYADLVNGTVGRLEFVTA